MKKILLSLIMIISMLSSVAFALDNSLNSIIVEGVSDNNYNVILRTDKVTNVKRTVKDNGVLVLELKNIATSLNLDTKYVNANNIDNVVVENTANNGVNIYIEAPNAGKADIIFDTPAAPPVVVGDGISRNQIAWIAAAFVLVFTMAGSFKKSAENDARLTYENDLAEREIKFYKEYKSDILTSARIDNKIKENLAKARIASVVKNSQKAATIRSLQKMSMR